MTRTGRNVAAVGTLLLLAGLLAGYPEVLGLGAACLAALAIAVVGLGLRPELEATRLIRPSRVTEGTPGTAGISVTNIGRRRAPPLLIRERLPGQELELAVPGLAPGATFEANYALNLLGRGVHSLGPATVCRCGLLRLASVTQTRLGASSFLVHPRYCLVDLATVGHAPATEGTTDQTSPRGGVEFHSLREYERGNDLRLVHWKASARAGTLMVRDNVVPQDPRLTVVLDTSDTYAGEAFEEAARHRRLPVRQRV